MKSKELIENQGYTIGPAKKVFSCRITDIESRSAKCERTGKEDTFYKFLFSDWVNVIAITRNREILLVKQFRFGTNQVELEIPGGGINRGEDPVEAGCRELFEETGYAGKNGRVIGKVCPNPAIQDNLCYTILVEDVESIGAQKQDDMEDIEIVLMDIEEIEQMAHGGDISHGLVLNALMFYNFWKQSQEG